MVWIVVVTADSSEEKLSFFHRPAKENVDPDYYASVVLLARLGLFELKSSDILCSNKQTTRVF